MMRTSLAIRLRNDSIVPLFNGWDSGVTLSKSQQFIMYILQFRYKEKCKLNLKSDKKEISSVGLYPCDQVMNAIWKRVN